MDRGAWPATVHGVTKESDTTQQLNNNIKNQLLLETLTEKSGSVSCGITAPFSWVLVHTNFCLYPPRVYFLVLCKFWQVYGGVNGDLLQEGLCHTQVCCSQSPCPCGRPLLTRTSTGDTQTHSKEFPDMRQIERRIKFIRVGDTVRTVGQLKGEPTLNGGPQSTFIPRVQGV